LCATNITSFKCSLCDCALLAVVALHCDPCTPGIRSPAQSFGGARFN
jgi:hypothetical protein